MKTAVLRSMCAVACAVTCLSWSPRSASAHATRASSVALDVQPDLVRATMRLPLDQLGLALHEPLEEPGFSLARVDARVRTYISEHLALRDARAQPYASRITEIHREKSDDGDMLFVRVDFEPPAGVDATSLVLHDDVIVDPVISHHVLVSLNGDFGQAIFGTSSKPRMLGVLGYAEKDVTVPRASASYVRGGSALFEMGRRHIAEGTDHLLFLLVLLFAAPLLAAQGRWESTRTTASTLRALLRVVTAFTIGHSLSLALAAFHLVVLPSQPIELAIAFSILLTAMHAIRPIFPRREGSIALSFGLVHGLAFATALEELGLRGKALVLALVGFNLGIEAMQLVVVLAVVPWLVLLARTPWYATFKNIGATLSAAAACAWITERATDRSNLVTRAIGVGGNHLFALGALLAVGSIVAYVASRVLDPGDALARPRVA